MKTSYTEWFKKVDELVKARIGMSVNDLDDVCLKDWHEDGVSPKAAASRAIRYSMSN